MSAAEEPASSSTSPSTPAPTRRRLPASRFPTSTATRAELAESGVEFERYDDEGGVTTDEDGIFNGPGFKAAWFKDPDGNIFAINA